jgi:hypothetical protein
MITYMSTIFSTIKSHIFSGHQWLTPVILATQEAEISRIRVRSQSRQIVLKTLSQKYPSQKGAEVLKV